MHEPAHLSLVHMWDEWHRGVGLGAEGLQHPVGDRHLPAEVVGQEPPAAVAVDQPDRRRERGPQRRLGLLVRHPADGDAGEGHAGLDQGRRRGIAAKGRRERRDDQNR